MQCFPSLFLLSSINYHVSVLNLLYFVWNQIKLLLNIWILNLNQFSMQQYKITQFFKMQQQISTQFTVKCEKAYRERLHELKKYILQMFMNLQKNEILKQMYGYQDLENLRFKKIEEIITEALQGEKEHHIQQLIEKNTALVIQIEMKNSEQIHHKKEQKKWQDKIQRIKIEYSHLMNEQKQQHEQDLNQLQLQFKTLFDTKIKQLQNELSKNMPHHNTKNNNEVEIESLKQKNIQYQKQLKEFIEELEIKDETINNLKTKLYQEHSNKLINNTESFKNMIEQYSILKKNYQLKEQEINKLKNQVSLLQNQIMILKKQQSQNLENLIKERIQTNHLPDLIHKNQLQLYKLHDQYENKLYNEVKKYNLTIQKFKQEILELKKSYTSEIQNLKKMLEKYNEKQSRRKLGKITSNKGRFKNIQEEFQNQLQTVRKSLNYSPTIRKFNLQQHDI